jgi:hypothetical protein
MQQQYTNEQAKAKEEIQALIDSFQNQNHDAMDETNTRRDFINNFFNAFG